MCIRDSIHAVLGRRNAVRKSSPSFRLSAVTMKLLAISGRKSKIAVDNLP